MNRGFAPLSRLDYELLEASFETLAVRSGEHRSEFHDLRRRKVTGTRKCERLAIERVEDVERGAFPDNPYPERISGCERRRRPVRVIAGEDNAHIVLALEELDAALHPVALVVADHQSGLIVLIVV